MCTTEKVCQVKAQLKAQVTVIVLVSVKIDGQFETVGIPGTQLMYDEGSPPYILVICTVLYWLRYLFFAISRQTLDQV